MLTRAQWTVRGLLRAAGVRGVFQKSPLARNVHRDTEGVRRRTPAPRQALGCTTKYYLGNLPTECRPERLEAIRPGDARAGAEDGGRDGAPTEQPGSEVDAGPCRPESLRAAGRREAGRGRGAERGARSLLAGAVAGGSARALLHPTRSRSGRAGRREPVYQPAIPSLKEDGYTLSFARGTSTVLAPM